MPFDIEISIQILQKSKLLKLNSTVSCSQYSQSLLDLFSENVSLVVLAWPVVGGRSEGRGPPAHTRKHCRHHPGPRAGHDKLLRRLVQVGRQVGLVQAGRLVRLVQVGQQVGLVQVGRQVGLVHSGSLAWHIRLVQVRRVACHFGPFMKVK